MNQSPKSCLGWVSLWARVSIWFCLFLFLFCSLLAFVYQEKNPPNRECNSKDLRNLLNNRTPNPFKKVVWLLRIPSILIPTFGKQKITRANYLLSHQVFVVFLDTLIKKCAPREEIKKGNKLLGPFTRVLDFCWKSTTSSDTK